jgi:hypothetical protein
MKDYRNTKFKPENDSYFNALQYEFYFDTTGELRIGAE